MGNNKKYVILIFILMFLALVGEFSFDIFDTQEDVWYQNFQLDSDALVYGKMIKSTDDISDADEHFLGRYNHPEKAEHFIINQNAFFQESDMSEYEYSYYGASLGLQGDFYVLIAKIFSFLPRGAMRYLLLLVNGSLLAGVMIIILYWIYKELGLLVSVFTGVCLIFMPWVVVMGKSLFWSIWTDFLPFTTVLVYFMIIEKQGKKYNGFVLNGIVFLSVFISLGCGYEYMTSVLIAMVTPIIYYSQKNEWDIKLTIKRFVVIISTALVAFGTTIFATLCKISIYQTNSLKLASEGLLLKAAKRTGFMQNSVELDTIYTDSLDMSIFKILYKYLVGEGQKNIVFSLNAFALVFIAIISIVAYMLAKNTSNSQYLKNKEKELKSLAVMILISLLAPVSWLVFAKGHSAIHLHINLILWSMPFAILVCAFVAAIAKEIIISYKTNK